MSKLLEEAIADAKVVREMAVKQAKAAMLEAFEPKIQNLVSSKLQEEEDEFDSEEVTEEDEFDSEEVTEEEDSDEAEKVTEEEDSDEAEEVTEEEDSDEAEEVTEEEDEELDLEGLYEEDDEEFSDDDLEEVIKELESEVDDEDEISEGEDDEEFDLDEIFEEEDDEEDKISEGDDDEEDEISEGDDDEEFDLDEIFEEEDSEEEVQMEFLRKENRNLNKKLAEALKVVKFQKNKLNEINILNAKLLFTNKVFGKFNLDNPSKIKVIENFDRAKNIREVKLVWATLMENMKAEEKRVSSRATKLMEGASKSIKSTKSKKSSDIVNEYDVDRVHKLMGIKK